MNKEQFLGQLRALLTVVGAALAAYGFHKGHQWEPVVGVMVLLASVGWSVYYKEGWAVVGSLLRKTVSSIGAAAVTYGLMEPGKAEALVGVVGPLLAIIGSWRAHKGGYPPVGGVVRLVIVCLAAGAVCGLSGCATDQGSATPGWWRPTTPADPAGKFGLLLEAAPGILVDEHVSVMKNQK